MNSQFPSNRLPVRMPDTSSVVLAAVSALVGSVLTIAGVAAWDAYDDNGASGPATVTGVIPGSGVTSDAVKPSNRGFRDFDPGVTYESGVQSSTRVTKLDSTGRAGFRDFDPAVTYGPGVQSSARVTKLDGTGRAGFRDFDPAVIYGEVEESPAQASGAVYPASREGRRGQVFLD